MAKKVVTTRESSTGRNEQFKDTGTGRTMTRPEFVKQIENGKYKDYHIREVNGVKTPASNPDGKKGNNLG